MRALLSLAVTLAVTGALSAPAYAGQTILRAFSPAGSDGSEVILQIDWAQVDSVAADVNYVLLRRKPAGPPVKADSIAVLQVGTARFVDTGLNPAQAYHYFAYFKSADGTTLRFGSFPAVVHLGPLTTKP